MLKHNINAEGSCLTIAVYDTNCKVQQPKTLQIMEN